MRLENHLGSSHLSILLSFTLYIFSFHFYFLSFFFFFFLLRISLVIHLLLPPFLSILSARSLPQSLPPLSLHASQITISHYFPSLSFLVVPHYLALVASTSLLSYCSSLPVMFKVTLDLS